MDSYLMIMIVAWTLIILYFNQMTVKNYQLVDKYKHEKEILEKKINKRKKYDIHSMFKEDPTKRGPGRSFNSRLINIPTRGESGDYQVVGFLTSANGDVLPLSGRQTYPGSNMWNYFTTTNTHIQVQIPVFDHNPGPALAPGAAGPPHPGNPKDDCQDNRGCPEFRSGDTAWANGQRYTVTMHRYNQLRYIPFV